MSTTDGSSLLRWEGAHLALDLRQLAALLADLLPTDRLENLALTGEGEALRVEATVGWTGIKTRIAVELVELRLRNGLLGGRIRRVSGVSGMPLPRGALVKVLERLQLRRVRVFGGDAIIVVDLRDLLPRTLDLGVVALQGTERTLHLWLGAGRLWLRQTRSEPDSS